MDILAAAFRIDTFCQYSKCLFLKSRCIWFVPHRLQRLFPQCLNLRGLALRHPEERLRRAAHAPSRRSTLSKLLCMALTSSIKPPCDAGFAFVTHDPRLNATTLCKH
jgi:hypothetical protein